MCVEIQGATLSSGSVGDLLGLTRQRGECPRTRSLPWVSAGCDGKRRMHGLEAVLNPVGR
jgi:hypothetical protein